MEAIKNFAAKHKTGLIVAGGVALALAGFAGYKSMGKKKPTIKIEE